MRLSGEYFDGRSARAQAVDLLIQPGEVWLRGEDVERREPLSSVRIGEQLGSAPRRIAFADGAHLEVADHDGFAQWLHAIGHRERHVDLAQRSWLIAALCVVGVVVAAFAAYRWGLPAGARYLAARVPPAVTRELSRGTLGLLDRHLLAPSRLDAARRQRLERGFAELSGDVPVSLQFRAAPRVGPNALALPDGTIVVLDELVGLAQHDEEILAVLAHELAHVEHHHSLRLMIEGTAMAAFIAWWIGDYSPLVAGAPVALLQARHTREIEAEADREAARRLTAQGIAPSRLADMLERIESAHAGTHQPDADEAGWMEYLSSHPATRSRIERLRAADAGGAD